LFFCGFEWKGAIRYKIIDDFDELITKFDHQRLRQYLHSYQSDSPRKSRLLLGMLRPMRLGAELFDRCWQFIRTGRQTEKPLIHRTAILTPREKIEIDKHAEIQEYVIIRAGVSRVSIGAYTQINPFTVIYGGTGVSIGNNVQIAPHCMLAGGNHDYIQTEKPIRFVSGMSEGPIIIEDNVWIAANSTITDGVRIGHDAVVGAGSVVTRDVKPYSIVAGAPAREIGNRLSMSG